MPGTAFLLLPRLRQGCAAAGDYITWIIRWPDARVGGLEIGGLKDAAAEDLELRVEARSRRPSASYFPLMILTKVLASTI